MGKKISFVSSKNRGITLDMLVVKDFFRVNDEKVEFKDVVANENAKNSLVKKGNISIRKEYCKNNIVHICCCLCICRDSRGKCFGSSRKYRCTEVAGE